MPSFFSKKIEKKAIKTEVKMFISTNFAETFEVEEIPQIEFK